MKTLSQKFQKNFNKTQETFFLKNQMFFDKHILPKFKAELIEMARYLELTSIKFVRFNNHFLNINIIELKHPKYIPACQKFFLRSNNNGENCENWFELPKKFVVPKNQKPYLKFVAETDDDCGIRYIYEFVLSKVAQDILDNILENNTSLVVESFNLEF